MPFKEEDFISESGNWNVASDYAREKIFKYLYYSDEYEKIAYFGYSELIEELNGNNYNVDELRLSGLRRLIHTLIMLINNTEFAIKGHLEELTRIRDELKRFEKVLDRLYKVKRDQVKNTSLIKLNKELFDKALDRIVELKAKINYPLNKSHLIFTDKKEFDIKSFKRNLKDRMINKG